MKYQIWICFLKLFGTDTCCVSMLSLKNMRYNRNSGVSDKLIFTKTRTAFDLWQNRESYKCHKLIMDGQHLFRTFYSLLITLHYLTISRSIDCTHVQFITTQDFIDYLGTLLPVNNSNTSFHNSEEAFYGRKYLCLR